MLNQKSHTNSSKSNLLNIPIFLLMIAFSPAPGNTFEHNQPTDDTLSRSLKLSVQTGYGAIADPGGIAYGAIADPAGIAYGAIADPGGIAYGAIADPAGIAYGAIADPAGTAYGTIADPAGIAYGAITDLSGFTHASGRLS